MQTTISSKGQVTVPKPIRDKLHLETRRQDRLRAGRGRWRAGRAGHGIRHATERHGAVPARVSGQSRGDGRGHREVGHAQAMIGVDTNVLARYIVQDDPEQADAAVRLIEGRCTAQSPKSYVSIPVLMELVWVLSAAYSLREVGRGICDPPNPAHDRIRGRRARNHLERLARIRSRRRRPSRTA